ncbi:unnamed protein product, partial [Mesorhabditis spiculigera]
MILYDEPKHNKTSRRVVIENVVAHEIVHQREPARYYDIRGMFSMLTYEKAAYGIYTMYRTMGEERMRNMLQVAALRQSPELTEELRRMPKWDSAMEAYKVDRQWRHNYALDILAKFAKLPQIEPKDN